MQSSSVTRRLASANRKQARTQEALSVGADNHLAQPKIIFSSLELPTGLLKSLEIGSNEPNIPHTR